METSQLHLARKQSQEKERSGTDVDGETVQGVVGGLRGVGDVELQDVAAHAVNAQTREVGGAIDEGDGGVADQRGQSAAT